MPSLVGKQVGSSGFGLMGLTWRAQPPSQAQAFQAMTAALNNGANFWNGGELYGPPDRHSCHLLNEYFKENPAAGEKVVLSIKGGLKPGVMAPDGSEENVRRSVEDCLKILDGTVKIDIFECARVDPKVPIETTMEALKKLVEEGKIGGIGLSEVSAKTIRKAHSIHPIAAVEGELSLWAIDNLENGVISTCAELGIPFIAYSPLGRGVLTGAIKKHADIPADSFLHHLPKYSADILDKNIQLVSKLEAISKRKNCTMAQMAMAWVKHLNGKPGMPEIIPIPGATTEARVNENFTDVALTDEESKEIDDILNAYAVRGDRYGGPGQALTEG
jgi:pyridoxine 4-dehydrogenase